MLLFLPKEKHVKVEPSGRVIVQQYATLHCHKARCNRFVNRAGFGGALCSLRTLLYTLILMVNRSAIRQRIGMKFAVEHACDCITERGCNQAR